VRNPRERKRKTWQQELEEKRVVWEERD